MAPLDAVVDSLDGVPEQYRELYQEADGRYRLDVQGVEFEENVKGLKSALQKEREAAKEAAQRLKQYEGFDPDEYHALKEAASKREDEEAAKRGEFDKLLQKKEEAYRKQLEQEQQTRTALESQVLGLIRDQEARTALARAGANVDLLLPHVLKMVDVVEEDGQRKAVVLGEKGAPRLNDEGAHMTISELVAEMAESEVYRAAFPGTVANGGGAAGNSAGRAEKIAGPDADWQAKADFIEKKGLNAYLDQRGLRLPTK